jgi:hypothetical protein
MSHMHQVGGLRKVHGTSISREIRRLGLIVVALAVLGYYLPTNRSMIVQSLRVIRRAATDAAYEPLHRARDLITFLK